jgi:hypothetical protein
VRQTYRVIRDTNREIERVPWQTFLRSMILLAKRTVRSILNFLENSKRISAFLLILLAVEFLFCILYLVEVQINMESADHRDRADLPFYLRVFRFKTQHILLISMASLTLFISLIQLVFVRFSAFKVSVS